MMRVCDCCRIRKKRCNGAKPCMRCERLSYECEYTINEAKRKLVQDFFALTKIYNELNAEAHHIQDKLQECTARSIRLGSSASTFSTSSTSSSPSPSSSTALVVRSNPRKNTLIINGISSLSGLDRLLKTLNPTHIPIMSTGDNNNNDDLVQTFYHRPFGKVSMKKLLGETKSHHSTPTKSIVTTPKEELIPHILHCMVQCNPLPYCDREEILHSMDHYPSPTHQSLFGLAILARQAIFASTLHLPCNPVGYDESNVHSIQEEFQSEAENLFLEIFHIPDPRAPSSASLIGSGAFMQDGDLKRCHRWHSLSVRLSIQMNFHKQYEAGSSCATPIQHRRGQFMWNHHLSSNYYFSNGGMPTLIPADLPLQPPFPIPTCINVKDQFEISEVFNILSHIRLEVMVSRSTSKAAKRKAYDAWYAQIPEYLRIDSSYYDHHSPCVKAMAHNLVIFRYCDLILMSPVLAKKQCSAGEKRNCVEWASEIINSFTSIHELGGDVKGVPMLGLFTACDVSSVILDYNSVERGTIDTAYSNINKAARVMRQKWVISHAKRYLSSELKRHGTLPPGGKIMEVS